MLLAGEDLAQMPARRHGRASGSEAIAVLSGDRPVMVSVDQRSPVRFSLQYTPLYPGSPVARMSDGREAVRFPLCGRGRRPFPGGVLFGGRGCARLDVVPHGRPTSTMFLPIAGSLRGCPAPRSRLPASADPYLGVACSTGNSIACDRVAIGVWMRRPATLVTVHVAGRLVTLSPSDTATPGRVLWQGHLERAGLRRGPLAIDLPAGDRRWLGTPIVRAPVRVTAFFGDGTAAAREATVQLHPGYR